MLMNRVILIVLDSLGVGEMPDADKYGDKGAATFAHIKDNMKSFDIPNLLNLGMGNIKGLESLGLAERDPIGVFGRCKEMSVGKDTITGHWEIAGIYTDVPFKTYPQGFPKAFIERFEKQIGRKTLANYPASGTEIIAELGAEHEATGAPIVYTSADSVFQIAANTAVIPLPELYKICEVARELLVGEFACGRVIARPYVLNDDGTRTRTSDRRDYAVSPPRNTLLDNLAEKGKTIYAVGKITDIFNGSGITEAVHTESNMNGVDKTLEAMDNVDEGLIFTNLVDFDSKFGHRRDPVGYGKAIEEFDERLNEILPKLREDDLLILCADHGNDPIHSGWDHTREYIRVLLYGKQIKNGYDLGTRDTFADIGATIDEIFDAGSLEIGKSFLKEIVK